MGFNTHNIIRNLRIMEKKMKEASVEVKAHAQSLGSSDLKSVPGLGKAAIEALNSAGISNLSQLLSAEPSVLKKALNPVMLRQVNNYLKENGNDAGGKEREAELAGPASGGK